MDINNRGVIDEFIKQHSNSRASLVRWEMRTSSRLWKKSLDVKDTFSDVDHVGNGQYVFNIAGDDYRLVAVINFETQIVNIKFIGTHAEYDKLNL